VSWTGSGQEVRAVPNFLHNPQCSRQRQLQVDASVRTEVTENIAIDIEPS